MKRFREFWNNITYLGLNENNRLVDDKCIMMSNRMNFVIIFILVIVSILMAILRFINHKEFSIHTKILLYAIAICVVNVFLSIKKKHSITTINLIFFIPLIVIFVPIFGGQARDIDYVYNPLIIIGFSFIPHLLLQPVFSNKVYIAALLYFTLQLLFLDTISQYFSTKPLQFFTIFNEQRIHYKIVLIAVFSFIQIIMYYLRNINFRYEKKLYDYNEELKSTIEELNAMQYQLVQSEKMASLGVLTSGVAHELNNPLNFICGGIHGIEDYVNEHLINHKEHISFYIDAINEGIDRSSKIVSSLNNYCLQNDNKLGNCDIHAILDNCIVMLQGQLHGNVIVTKSYAPNKLIINGNDGKLHQSFLNVLLNSIQSIEGSGEITIETQRNDTNIDVIISDTGCGINPEYLNQIFDPFFTTKDPGKGTGLGLSETYKIVNEHDGRIKCFSHYSKGTKILITLPLIVS
jgi:signal transduction histidine kinase